MLGTITLYYFLLNIYDSDNSEKGLTNILLVRILNRIFEFYGK